MQEHSDTSGSTRTMGSMSQQGRGDTHPVASTVYFKNTLSLSIRISRAMLGRSASCY